jgi:hypothetical protein
MSDDEWSDEDVRNKEPTAKVIGTCMNSPFHYLCNVVQCPLFFADRVKEDYLPPTHKHLTLIQGKKKKKKKKKVKERNK